MQVAPIKTRVFAEGESLKNFIIEHIPTVPEGAVLAVTSKIVALAEGRTVPIEGADKAALIQKESDTAIETEWVWLTVKDGAVLASAGIDESNAEGVYILLPENSFKSAATLRDELRTHYGIESLGVVITDSRTAPLRSGVTAVALGWAGVQGIRSYEGMPDIFGKPFRYERVNVADSVATAAALVMGEGAEQQPLAVITNAPVEYTDAPIDPNETVIDPKDDLYKPFFDALGA